MLIGKNMRVEGIDIREALLLRDSEHAFFDLSHLLQAQRVQIFGVRM